MKPKHELTAAGMAMRTAIILFLFIIVFTGLLAGAYLWTKPAIEISEAEEKMKLIGEILPTSEYNNQLLEDTLSLPPTPALGLREASIVYRARKNGAPAAIVLETVAPDGYAGKIRLIIAIRADGRIVGVRVVQHKETPGLGDYIEPKKDKNKARPWVTQFENLSLAEVPDAEWKVKKDGGRFDYYAGATVTPRAVVKAVHRAARFAADNREMLYATAGARP
ncbi:MAG: electron transport complex subunit RsxG [Betaproteobacteria bacterium]